jgi:hypothetical protein
MIVEVPFKESLLSKHTTSEPKGRVVKSAGTRTSRKPSGPAAGITALGADRVVADKAQAYCPRLEGLAWSGPLLPADSFLIRR